MMKQNVWLVVIGVKDWVYTKTESERTISYIQIELPTMCDEYNARYLGFVTFEKSLETDKEMSDKIEKLGGIKNICAPEAVKL